jgi:DNA modification methylase
MAAPTRTLQPQHVDLGERGIYHTGNRLNDLTGKEWVFATRSVLNKSYPPSYQFELRSQHGGQKPPELCAELISTFTKRGMRVLDPFMGVGGTLLGAALSGRRATGIEINPRWVEIYREVCRREGLAPLTPHIGDCRAVLPGLEGPYDFLLTDVPYWDMDRRRRSTGKWKRAGGEASARRASKLTPFDISSPQDRDMRESGTARIEEQGAWLQMLGEAFTLVRPLLRPRAYLAVFIGDMYHSGRYHPLSALLTGLLDSLGYTMKANLIWYDVSKKLSVYGYRYEFIPSMTHQSILVFRNESA